MRLIVQRVDSAQLYVDNNLISHIANGFCVYLGAKCGDDKAVAEKLAKKLIGLRIFRDENDKMNLALNDVGGEILLVSNFTIYADCSRGYRPNFSRALQPDKANELYEYFADLLRKGNINVQTGIFGAHMKIDVQNNGPVNIVLDSDEF